MGRHVGVEQTPWAWGWLAGVLVAVLIVALGVLCVVVSPRTELRESTWIPTVMPLTGGGADR